MLADEKKLVATQRSIVLDPFDEKVIEAAREEGISDDWIDAAQRSGVYKLFKKWELALPLHPEFRTLPSLFYIMPQSPITTSAGESSPDAQDVFDMTSPGEGGPIIDPDALDKFRLPLQYLANMFAAGDETEVRKSLRRQLAVRHYGRSLRVEKSPDLEVLEKEGLTQEDADGIVRALSLAFYNERFVVPTTKREESEISPYTERGFAGFSQMTPWSPMQRRKSYHAAYHTPGKKHE
jgi:nitrate reductase beta subunit